MPQARTTTAPPALKCHATTNDTGWSGIKRKETTAEQCRYLQEHAGTTTYPPKPPRVGQREEEGGLARALDSFFSEKNARVAFSSTTSNWDHSLRGTDEERHEQSDAEELIDPRFNDPQLLEECLLAKCPGQGWRVVLGCCREQHTK